MKEKPCKGMGLQMPASNRLQKYYGRQYLLYYLLFVVIQVADCQHIKTTKHCKLKTEMQNIYIENSI